MFCWVLRIKDFRFPKIGLHGESNTGFRGKGRPKRNYRSCIKVDLKQFNLWDIYQQSSSQERVPDREKMAKFNRDVCFINPSEKSIEYNLVIKKDKSRNSIYIISSDWNLCVLPIAF